MNKKRIIEQLKSKVNGDIAKAQQSLNATRSLATQDDMKAECKWDTRATEAKYLADGQEQRVEELKSDLQLLDDIDLEVAEKDKSVSIGSVVEIEFNKIVKNYFISPTAGGTQLLVDNVPVLVLSVFSPIGKEAISLTPGDEFEVETPKENRLYKVRRII